MLKIGSRNFSPSWGASLAAAVAVAIMVSLGNWQTRRAEEKLALQEKLDIRGRGVALQVPSRLIDAKNVEFARVTVRGEFLRRRTILLDNQVRKGVVGYDVLTPLRIEGGELCVLVNRGWIAAGLRRDVLPIIPTPAGTQSIEGIAVLPSHRYFELGADGETGRQSGGAMAPVWQHLNLERYAEATGLAVQPFFIRQTSAGDDGLARVWDRLDRGVDINRGYAFQWYSFAALILVLYVSLNLRIADTQPPRQD